MVKAEQYSGLAPALRQQLAHCIDEEFGHVAFVQEREWAQPDWVLAKYEGKELATFCNVVLRRVLMDGQLYTVAGINNVITPRAFRGRGYASQVLRETEQFIFEELECAFGLLLCADALLPFYSRLGWYKLENCSLRYHQPSGEQLYDSNVMLLSPGQQRSFRPQHINLNGLPW